MNERIKEVANAALIGGRTNQILDNEFLEKFAELIVKECASIYDKIDNGNEHMGTHDYLEALHKTFRS